MNKVEEFIEKFKFKYKKELEYVFSYGNCYYFALILKDRFHGEIYYLPIKNHFICKIEKEYYDINGKASMNEQPLKWDVIKKTKLKMKEQVARDCLKFETRKLEKE